LASLIDLVDTVRSQVILYNDILEVLFVFLHEGLDVEEKRILAEVGALLGNTKILRLRVALCGKLPCIHVVYIDRLGVHREEPVSLERHISQAFSLIGSERVGDSIGLVWP
jgi:hypothetical protein